MRTEFDEQRSKCSCKACTSFCHAIPGYLIPADLERMMPECKTDEDYFAWAENNLLASPGALLKHGDDLYRIPTLVPAHKSDQDPSCKFFTADRKCSIHEVAPFGCAFYDCLITETKANMLTNQAMKAILKDRLVNGLYSRVWDHLNEIGKVSPPPEWKRAALKELQERKYKR